ncbi:MAG: S8 family serine peptidase [Ignavibacteria bacterium]|jgi:subtilisin family serine protease|nr:S8 family serine peptidase [Ignavibacteria bacterium]MCU7505215.1 S8 family serine peptidase [Ignavibacteria bacterium]MCU7517291.1 S8 family serine peptidase [Ignavibacteria bacterium]
MIRKFTGLFFFVLLSNLAFSGISQNGRVLSHGKIHYLPGEVVVRLKSAMKLNKLSAYSSLNKKLSTYGIRNISGTFSEKAESLSDIVTIQYSAPIDPADMAEKVKSTGEVLWAEPHFVYRTSAVPNDPSYGLQWNLSRIQAELAWAITKGSESVIIGIVDTGVEWGHPDLQDKIWVNTKEIAGNGIDDDNNGYIDDIRGWDFGGAKGTSDNDPNEDQPDHGTHVAGIAAANTGNGKGISSIGYNCKIMPVKVSRNDDRDAQGEVYIDYGYEGIVYAVDNGANVINCSWGGDGYSQLGQEVINYAIKKNVLVVTSAGNESSGDASYPAAFNGVLSVGSTDENDAISYFSNYGPTLDVFAPGRNIYSTWQPGTYINLSGTSMSSPLVAGLAGLVRTVFPNYSALQVAEQIRVNCDNIDAMNSTYKYMLGGGRINAYKAVSNLNSKSVRGVNFVFSDEFGNNNGVFEPGETISLSADFVNYLNPVSSLNITLQSLDGYASVSAAQISSGGIPTLGTFNNGSNKFKFNINSDVPSNYEMKFLIKYNDGSYSDFQVVTLKVNPSYVTQSTGKVNLTITSKGVLGFNDYPTNLEGDGFSFNGGPNLLFEGALMYGTSETKLPDAARYGDEQDQDFRTVKNFVLTKNEARGLAIGKTVFSDDVAGLGLETSLYSYSFLQEPDNKFILLRYRFANKSGGDITGFRAGLFLDWDINADTSGFDNAYYDQSLNFGYALSQLSTPGVIAGCALVSSDNFGYYAIKNDGTDGGVGLYTPNANEFTKREKWITLSNGTTKNSAGTGDISMVVSGGPFNIKASDTLEVAFAIFAGQNMAELKNTVQSARLKYSEIMKTLDTGDVPIPYTYSLSQNFPNPFNPGTKIEYSIPEASEVSLKVYNILGREVATLFEGYKSRGNYTVEFKSGALPSGIYIYRLRAGSYTATKKMTILK